MSRILIADDDDSIRRLLTRFLSTQGHEVIAAENGRQAVELARASNPDVIVLDVSMPEMNGVEACVILRSDPGLSVTPILMLSGQSDRESRLRGIAAGASDYLTKPVDIEDLDLRIRNAITMKGLYDQLQARYDELAAMKELRDDLTQMLIADNQRMEAVAEARDRVREAADGLAQSKDG
jgi:DNA-binding response OmpR family regulator